MATRSSKKRPTRKTERLVLRPFEPSDAPRVAFLAGDRDVAKTTLALGHPYELSSAENWIASHQEAFEKGKQVVFAITLKNNHELIGAMGLVLNLDQELAEVGYWIGKSRVLHGGGARGLTLRVRRTSLEPRPCSPFQP